MTAKRHDRGEWRPLFESWPDGPEFQQLAPPARLTLYTLKLKLGPFGIRAIAGRQEALEEWTGYARSVVADAERMLREHGWIELDGPIVWLIRGLEFEPTLSANDPKHRLALHRHLSTLPSRWGILARFVAHYPIWCPDSEIAIDAKGLRSPFEGPSKGHRSTTPTPTPTLTPKSNAAAARARSRSKPSEGDRLLRRLTDSPEVQAMAGEMGEMGGSALLGYLTGATDPPRLWLEIRSYLEGTHGPGGRKVAPPVLGKALHAMALGAVPMSPRRLASYVRKEVEDLEPPAAPRRSREPPDSEDELVAAGKRLDQQRRAHAS